MTEAVIGSITREKAGSTCRVFSQFDGIPACFESNDVELEPSIEAFGSLWLIPCILAKRDLRFEKPICKTWYENALKLMDYLSDCWGTAKIKILAETRETQLSPQRAEAVCFSGGVDSFYTLRENWSPKYLLRAEPFAISANSPEISRRARKRLEKVADAVGAVPLTIKYNLLEHPSHNMHNMNDTYTGILAGMGHLLSPYIGSLFISSSHQKDEPFVYACRCKTDPLLSSALMQVHHPAEIARREKVAAIADWQLAQENLFVCFKGHGSELNCSACEKCVRTMLDLHILGKLDSFKSFDLSTPLWEAMDKVGELPNPSTYYSALAMSLDPRVANGIWRLLRREHERVWKLEVSNRYRRQVDEEFPKLQEGLSNALHHYSLLQEENQKLAADYAAIAGSLPIRNGLKLIRNLARKLRASSARQGALPDRIKEQSMSESRRMP